MPRQAHLDLGAAGVIPGIVSHYPNDHVNTLKGPGWTSILNLLGKEAERIMLDLLLDNDIFVPVATGSGNYYQLSGKCEASPLGGHVRLTTSSKVFPYPSVRYFRSPLRPHRTI